jgi:hypothetical protein
MIWGKCCSLHFPVQVLQTVLLWPGEKLINCVLINTFNVSNYFIWDLYFSVFVCTFGLQLMSWLLLFLLFWGVGLLQTGSHCDVQAGLELLILLPQLPERWDYRHVPLHPAMKFLLK